MKIVVFGLSLSSSWGNGHATTYRSLLRAFAARGHSITFFEWDAPWYRGEHRDLPEPEFARLVLYDGWDRMRGDAIGEARDADVTIVGSYVNQGILVIDDLIAAGVGPLVFYDIDTPVTVAALRRGDAAYLRANQVPLFDRYLSFTGGPFLRNVVEGELGARAADPLYCCVDTARYYPLANDPEFAADLAYMGTYAPDRQPVVERFVVDVARRLPGRRFLVAGPQYPNDLRWPDNVRLIPHVPPARHAAFYSSARWQLNATRADMVAAGWSPSVRLFEAGATGAAIISDYWPGIDELFAPGRELLLPSATEEVVEIIATVPDAERMAIGGALRARVLAEHSAARRAAELEAYLQLPPTTSANGGSVGYGEYAGRVQEDAELARASGDHPHQRPGGGDRLERGGLAAAGARSKEHLDD
jgi:spore maturation protein CgeB